MTEFSSILKLGILFLKDFFSWEKIKLMQNLPKIIKIGRVTINGLFGLKIGGNFTKTLILGRFSVKKNLSLLTVFFVVSCRPQESW